MAFLLKCQARKQRVLCVVIGLSKNTLHLFGPKMASTNPFDDCFNPVCSDKVNAFKAALGAMGGDSDKEGGEGKKQEASSGSAPKPNSSTAPLPYNNTSMECPPDRSELGNHSWNLLHTMGAYYPDAPTPDEQHKMKAFIDGITSFFPCNHCRTDFEKNVEKSPPRVESRTDLSVWLCEQHNSVNAKIHKPQFPCDIASLDLRWKYGRKNCWTDGDAGFAEAEEE